LLATTDCAVIVCGRSAENAQAIVAGFPQYASRLSVAVIDRGRASAADVAALNAFCVVDAAGPFQAQEPVFARAVIEAGAHYVDLADARDFVAGFGALDAEAKARGVLAVTGASSTPALAHAVLDDVTRGWVRVDDVEIAIAPGNQSSPLGLSVFQSILSYVGKPVRVWLHGRWAVAPGWGLTVRRRIGDLGPRWLSLVETPDLDLIPQRFPAVRNAVFRAGLELLFFHQGLVTLGVLVRLGLLKSLRPLSEVLRDTAALFRRWGSDCGGMTVDVTGVYADWRRLGVTWTLIAESGDGPKIPTLPALAVVRGLLSGRIALRGAMPCVGVVDLQTIEAEFKRFDIRTARHTRALERAPLFQRAVDGFGAMPEAVRTAHAFDPARDLHGRVDVDGAQTWLARVVARAVGFPATGRDLPAAVTMERDGDGEIWIRRFGTYEFRSILNAGDRPGALTERFGALTFDLDARADASGFTLAITRARLGQIRLPRVLTPQTQAAAHVDEQGRYRFDVTIEMPLIGRLVRYRGWLQPQV
jgi:saccharopine dehydrogenase-like NADP-dependent oxidoreductase